LIDDIVAVDRIYHCDYYYCYYYWVD